MNIQNSAACLIRQGAIDVLCSHVYNSVHPITTTEMNPIWSRKRKYLLNRSHEYE
jgi:hypothetical protein